MTLAKEALQFLRSTHSGVLSTFSSKFEGYPFGSVAPFMLDHSGQPVILISTIAEHTKNMLANPKVALLVLAGTEDLQANARLTLIGEAKQIDKNTAALKARYLRYFPQAAQYFEMHDFNFYQINIHQIRYIAGFGKMGWVSADDFLDTDPPSALIEQEQTIVDHMNHDHSSSLIAYCKHFHGIDATKVSMLGIDRDGFDVHVHQNNQTQIVRFNFEQAVYDAASARQALVAMSKAANTAKSS